MKTLSFYFPKRFLSSSFFLSFLFLLLLSACESDLQPITENVAESEMFKVEEYTKDMSLEGIKIPDNSKVEKTSDGSEITISFPMGIEYITYNEKTKEMTSTPYFKYTCSCSVQGEGCNVIQYDGEYGCMQGTCTGSCTGTPGKPNTRITKGGFIKLNEGISFLDDQSKIDNLFRATPALLAHEKVQRAISAFNIENYGQPDPELPFFEDGELLPGFREVGINLFGALATYVVRDGRNGTSTRAGKWSCSCDSGSEGCTKGSSLLVRICLGGECNQCTMSDGSNQQ